MDSLFPLSTVRTLVENILLVPDDKLSRSNQNSLSALLRHVPYRPDLFPIYGSLTSSKKLKYKLVSYQLCVRNRNQDDLILIFNQALKDLSSNCFNVSLMALQILYIPLFNSNDQSLVEDSTLSLIKDSSTQRGALSALYFLKDWNQW